MNTTNKPKTRKQLIHDLTKRISELEKENQGKDNYIEDLKGEICAYQRENEELKAKIEVLTTKLNDSELLNSEKSAALKWAAELIKEGFNSKK